MSDPEGGAGFDGRPEWSSAHGTLLRALRQERRWSQRALAEAAGHGVTQQDVSERETDASTPSGPKFVALCRAVAHSPEDFQARARHLAGAMDGPGMAAGAQEPRGGLPRASGEGQGYGGGAATSRTARTAPEPAGAAAPPTLDALFAMLRDALAIARTQAETSTLQARAAEEAAGAAREAATLAREAARALSQVLSKLESALPPPDASRR